MESETNKKLEDEVWRMIVKVTADCVAEKKCPSDKELSVHLGVFNQYQVPYKFLILFVKILI